MKKIADEIQKLETGIELDDEILTILIYADDICIISCNPESAKEAFNLLEKLCNEIGMKVNIKKSEYIKNSDFGMEILNDYPLELVEYFKYLGVQLQINKAQYMSKNSKKRLEKARSYALSVINMARESPCPSMFARRIWQHVALPAIFYGSEAVLVRKDELAKIEREQAKVAKFILQVPANTANVVAQVLTDMEPIETYYWRRVLDFYVDLHVRDPDTWTAKAFKESHELGEASLYHRIINEKIEELRINSPKEREAALIKHSVEITNQAIFEAGPTCMALDYVTEKKHTRSSFLFRRCESSKTYHEFVTMNAGLGNRMKLDRRERMRKCMICSEDESCLNEVHLLFICPTLNQERDKHGIVKYMEERKGLNMADLYKDYWNEFKTLETLQERVKAAEGMRTSYLQTLGKK